MLEMNLKTCINNVNYLRYMEEQEKLNSRDNDNEKIKSTWRESYPPQIENAETHRKIL